MNIHLPAILMFTRGTRVLTHPHISIENGPVEIVDLPIENGGSFHSYVLCLPEGIPPTGLLFIIAYHRFFPNHGGF